MREFAVGVSGGEKSTGENQVVAMNVGEFAREDNLSSRSVAAFGKGRLVLRATARRRHRSGERRGEEHRWHLQIKQSFH